MKKILVISSILLVIVVGVLFYYNSIYRQKIGTIYMYNMESLVRSLNSLDKIISSKGTITTDEYSITYLNNAVLVDQYPGPLGIDFYITEINDGINKGDKDIKRIQADIQKLRDAMMQLVYKDCKQDPFSVFALQDSNNSSTKKFVAETYDIIN